MKTQRRNRMDLWTPAEEAIQNAIWEVEKVGADVKLTESITLLSKAKELLSDYIDDKIPTNGTIFIDGDFNNSYESRVRGNKNK